MYWYQEIIPERYLGTLATCRSMILTTAGQRGMTDSVYIGPGPAVRPTQTLSKDKCERGYEQSSIIGGRATQRNP
eukprot:scaffold401061_cov47-Prasinocladus_malaysianus.AAC.1